MLRRLMLRAMIIITFLAAAAAAGSLLPHAEAANQPIIQLGSIQYPSIVRPGTAFQINVTASYSGNFLSDIGLWDTGTGLMVQSMTFISQFAGPGNVSFTLPLVAPERVGPWHLLVVNRVWWENAWYQDPKGGEEAFTVTIADDVVLTVGSSGVQAQISVDDVPYQVPSGSEVALPLAPGWHILEAPTLIQQGMGTRFVFVGWSDGVGSDPHTVFITQAVTLYVEYRTEYYLSTKSQVGQVVGGGWYAKGTEATVAVPPSVTVPGSFGLTNQYRFDGWSGDSDSTSNIVEVTMDGPKQLTANWVNVGTQIDSGILTGLLLLFCVPLLGRLIFIRSGRRHRDGGSRNLRLSIVWVVLALILMPLAFPAAHAQLIPQPRATIVQIGDAEWYYWSKPGSDTCLIWLGGGIPEVAEPGSYGYLINPYDYESFDTIHFIQDLTNFYCLIALQHGPIQAFDPAANRTIYQEFFQPQTTTIEEIHRWILNQGYVHTFVIGYSVGGQAAAADLTLSHPGNWTTEDGLILITVPFSQDVIENANELRTNLFLIYGGNLPDYEATGIQFYNDTKPDGPSGTGYFHKEFHVIDDAGHEVWTLRATGTYDTGALNLIVGFIERSKNLQTRNLPLAATNPAGNEPLRITSVLVPSEVRVWEAFPVECNLTFTGSVNQPTILVAYGTNNDALISEAQVTLTQPNVSLVIPPFLNVTKFPLTFLVMQESNGGWVPASNEFSTEVSITALNALTVQTSYPNIGFQLDGKQFSTNSTGFAELQVAAGPHLLQAEPFIYQGNASRLRFVDWGDSMNQTSREIQVEGNTALEISYVQQYLVEVNSPYGQTLGSGWYDVNSTIPVLVQPPIVASPSTIFSHWSFGTNESEVPVLVQVASPVVIYAVWSSTKTSEPSPVYVDPWFISALFAFAVLVVLNVKLGPKRRR